MCRPCQDLYFHATASAFGSKSEMFWQKLPKMFRIKNSTPEHCIYLGKSMFSNRLDCAFSFDACLVPIRWKLSILQFFKVALCATVAFWSNYMPKLHILRFLNGLPISDSQTVNWFVFPIKISYFSCHSIGSWVKIWDFLAIILKNVQNWQFYPRTLHLSRQFIVFF